MKEHLQRVNKIAVQYVQLDGAMSRVSYLTANDPDLVCSGQDLHHTPSSGFQDQGWQSSDGPVAC